MAGGFKDFTAATALSADVDNYLMRQSMMRFASTAARDSALSGNLEDGMHCITLDTHSIWIYVTAAWLPYSTPWTTYTPSWTHLTVGNGVTDSAKYRYHAGDFRVRGHFTCGTTTTGDGSTIQLTIPNSVTADSGGADGTGRYNDASAPRIYLLGPSVAVGDTQIVFNHTESPGVLTSTSPVTIATSDIITWDITVPVLW